MSVDIEKYLLEKQNLVNTYLSSLYSSDDSDKTRLNEAINYSLTSGGKRIRPILCLAACDFLSGSFDAALGAACSIEMVHAFSLIHDDLPSMDNDEIRRGKPTNHVVFGESTAILAGDALLADSFHMLVKELAGKNIESGLILEIISILSGATGSVGMIMGQAMDLSIEGLMNTDIEHIKKIHSLKTGALIESSVVIGALIGGAKARELNILKSFSRYLGLSFQITDDILDMTGSKDFGKPAGSDAKNHKPTFASILGIEKSKNMVGELTNEALSELEKLKQEPNILSDITIYLSERTK